MRFGHARADLQALSPRTRTPGWIVDLERLLVADPPRTDYARWLAHAAHRWAALDPEFLTHASLGVDFASIDYEEEGPIDAVLDRARLDEVTKTMLSPWVDDANLFDEGLFDLYLECLAPMWVVDLCPEVREWVETPMRSLLCTGDVLEDGSRYVDAHSGEEFLIVEPPGPPPPAGERCLGRPLLVTGGRHVTSIPMMRLGSRLPERRHLSATESWLGWLSWLLADPTLAA